MNDLQRRVLRDVLVAQIETGVLTNLKQYRMDLGDAGRAAFDYLRQREFIEDRGRGFQLRLRGLWSLAHYGGDQADEAQAIVRDCDEFLRSRGNAPSVFSACYAEQEDGQFWSIAELCARAGLELKRGTLAISFLCELFTVANWQRAADQTPSGAHINESVLSMDSLEQVLTKDSINRTWAAEAEAEDFRPPPTNSFFTLADDEEDEDPDERPSPPPPVTIDAFLKQHYNVTRRGLIKRVGFIRDEALRHRVYYNALEATQLLRSDYWKPALIAAGSVIEAVLNYRLAVVPQPELAPALRNVAGNKPFDKYTFFDLIKLAEKLALLTSQRCNMLHGVRDFRNFVHLEREAREPSLVTMHDARMAVDALFVVIAELKS